jgi:hypothetical protein
MGIAANPVAFAANDQGRFGVRLEAGDTVNDVDPGFAHEAGPFDVGGFIEARLQLDDNGDLFAVARRFDQLLHER